MSFTPNSPVLDAGMFSPSGNSGGGGTTMCLPLDLFEKNERPQYIVFYANVVAETKFSSIGDGSSFSKTESPSRNAMMKQGTSINTAFDRYKRVDQAVALSIPSGLSHAYSVNWSSQETGTMGAIARSLADPINAAINSKDGARLSSFVENFQSSPEKYDGLAKDLFQYALYNTINKSDTGRVMQAATKVTTNPHVEVLFDGVGGNRTFNYSFKFYPTSEEESQTISSVIQFFRFHSAPEVTIDEGYGRFYRYPSTFDIEVMNGGARNEFLVKYFSCACTSVNTNYNGTNWVTFANGAPSEVSLELSFVELEQITKEKIVEGF